MASRPSIDHQSTNGVADHSEEFNGAGPVEHSAKRLRLRGGLPISEPAFLTREQEQQAKDEVAALNAHPIGMEWLGRRTIDYVKAHPDEPVAAESLALVVKMTRYECYRTEDYGKSPSLNVSKEAFTLLHSRYPESDWPIRTKYEFLG